MCFAHTHFLPMEIASTPRSRMRTVAFRPHGMMRPRTVFSSPTNSHFFTSHPRLRLRPRPGRGTGHQGPAGDTARPRRGRRGDRRACRRTARARREARRYALRLVPWLPRPMVEIGWMVVALAVARRIGERMRAPRRPGDLRPPGAQPIRGRALERHAGPVFHLLLIHALAFADAEGPRGDNDASAGGPDLGDRVGDRVVHGAEILAGAAGDTGLKHASPRLHDGSSIIQGWRGSLGLLHGAQWQRLPVTRATA